MQCLGCKWVFIFGFPPVMIHLQIRTSICTALTADAVAADEVLLSFYSLTHFHSLQRWSARGTVVQLNNPGLRGRLWHLLHECVSDLDLCYREAWVTFTSAPLMWVTFTYVAGRCCWWRILTKTSTWRTCRLRRPRMRKKLSTYSFSETQTAW